MATDGFFFGYFPLDDEMERWLVQMCETMFPFQAALGIFGNFVNLLVLLSRPMRSRTNTLLAFAAISDIFFLTALIPHNMARRAAWMFQECAEGQSPVNAQNPNRCFTEFASFYVARKMNFTFLANWFSASSSWLMVAVSFDRLWAIKSPFTARTQRCTYREFAVVPIIFLFTAAITFYHNYTFKAVQAVDGGRHVQQSTLSENVGFILTVINVTCQIFVPLLMLVLLNAFLIYYLRNRRQLFETAAVQDSSRRSTKSSSDENPPLLEGDPISGVSIRGQPQQQLTVTAATTSTPHATMVSVKSNSSSIWTRQLTKAERHVTITVTAIVSCYVITHFPSAFLFANMYIFHVNNMYSQKSSYTWVAVSNFIAICGKVANFFLFCLSSKHFRFHLRKKLLFWRRNIYSSKKKCLPRIKLHTAVLHSDCPGTTLLQRDSNALPRTRSLPLNQFSETPYRTSPV